MKKIKRFNQFINEGYSLSKSLNKAGAWIKNFFSAIKEGIIRLIPKGPKKGLPMVYYFKNTGPGSIVDEVRDFYSGALFESEEYFESYELLEDSNIKDYSEEELEKRLSMEGGVENADAKKIAEEIRRLYVTNLLGTYNKPIFLYGAPGIGKSEIVAQVADKIGCDLLIADLQFMQPADFLGVPSKVDIESPSIKFPFGKGVTRDNPPVWLPIDNGTQLEDTGEIDGDGNPIMKEVEGKGGILFLDEMNRANERVMSGLLSLTGRGRNIGSFYKLPSKWIVIAAGNRKKDEKPGKANTIKDLGKPGSDRFTFLNYVPTVKGFISHVTKTNQSAFSRRSAKTSAYNPNIPLRTEKLRDVVLTELLQFLYIKRGWLHTLDPLSKAIKASSPRSWIDGSLLLYSELDAIKGEGGESDIYKMKTDEASALIKEIFGYSVGAKAANEFSQFFEETREVSDSTVMGILDGNIQPKKERDDLTAKILVTSVAFRCGKMFPDADPSKVLNALKYAEGLGSDELYTMMFDILDDLYDFSNNEKYLDVLDGLKKLPSKFIGKYGSYIRK